MSPENILEKYDAAFQFFQKVMTEIGLTKIVLNMTRKYELFFQIHRGVCNTTRQYDIS